MVKYSIEKRFGDFIFNLGLWQVIVQTEDILQRVGVDMCHDPDLPCPGLADCGKKSRCVQRYNYQVGVYIYFKCAQ